MPGTSISSLEALDPAASVLCPSVAYFDVDLCATADVVTDARIALEDAVDHVYVVGTCVRMQAYAVVAEPASFYV